MHTSDGQPGPIGSLPTRYPGGELRKTIRFLRCAAAAGTSLPGVALSEEDIPAALDLGARLRGGYTGLVSSGAQRAMQTLGCLLAALGEKVEGGLGWARSGASPQRVGR